MVTILLLLSTNKGQYNKCNWLKDMILVTAVCVKELGILQTYI